MARETLIKCDVCGDEDAEGHQVTVDGVTTDIDLCAAHLLPLTQLLAHGHSRPGDRPDTPRSLKQLDGLIRLPDQRREA